MSNAPPNPLIDRICQYFAEKGWQPLLPVKGKGLKALSAEKLERLLTKVIAAPDRLIAVTVILEAVIPGNEPPAVDETQSLSDTAILRLRRHQK